MNVNSTHFEYEASLAGWSRARVMIAGERCLLRLDLQRAHEFAAYRCRASYFNAPASAADGYMGLIFGPVPFHRLPALKLSLENPLASLVGSEVCLSAACGVQGACDCDLVQAAIFPRNLPRHKICQIVCVLFFVEGFRIQGSGCGSLPRHVRRPRNVRKPRANFAPR